MFSGILKNIIGRLAAFLSAFALGRKTAELEAIKDKTDVQNDVADIGSRRIPDRDAVHKWMCKGGRGK